MKHITVTLEEKIVVGVSAQTSNEDPKMTKIIGGLWETLYNTGIYGLIKNKRNEYAIGLYSDYTEDGGYTVTAGVEVGTPDNDDLTVKVIPAGKYAKFEVRGDLHVAVAEAWKEIWSMDLERSYTGDFEEYLTSDVENAQIDIYIALK
ncbi:MAG: GyrI-like domain-containing protein [bacterium]|nr:GyrI-like domain-containing protein [bacterium]